jgi:hypothetical protein
MAQMTVAFRTGSAFPPCSIGIMRRTIRGFGRDQRADDLTIRRIPLLAASRIAVVVLALLAALPAAALAPEVLATRIRESAASIPDPDLPHPLPLAAHWNTGHVAGGWDPAHQLALFLRGRYLLPWFELPRPDRDLPVSYYEPAFGEFARLRMPVSFISTQWDVLVAEDLAGPRPRGMSDAEADAWRPPPLSPTSPLGAWYAAGLRWGSAPVLRRLQAAYPDPPLVVFVSNNEQPRLTWTQAREAGLKLPGAGPEASDEQWRRSVGDAWTERYRELFRGFRDALDSDHWRRRARFVGYEAYGQPALGRWSGWVEYSLHTQDRPEPWSAVWDGASVSYYLGDWNPSTDFRVWSPQIESMNLLPMLTATRLHSPGFWFEISTWDGRSDELPIDKGELYRTLHQSWDPERYGGMVQFGMWLLRPRVVREFRDTLSLRQNFQPFFDAVLDAVGRVHENPVLERYWREGRLVRNVTTRHPYQSAIPEAWRSLPRWFLLESDANPPGPWTLETPLQVFALALETGRAPRREWLVLAVSPQVARRETQVILDTSVRPRLHASRGGCFSLVRETGAVELVSC